MFIDSVVLSRKAWYMRLLHFVFPKVPEYNNFCPIFWLIVLSAIFFIPKALVWGLFSGVLYIVDQAVLFAHSYDRRVVTPRTVASNKLKLMSVSPEEMLKAYIAFDGVVPVHIDPCIIKKYRKMWWRFYTMAGIEAGAMMERANIADKTLVNAWFMEEGDKYIRRLEKSNARAQKLENIKDTFESSNRKFHLKMIKLAKVLGPILAALAIIAAIVLIAYGSYWIIRGIGWLFYWIAVYWSKIWRMGLLITGASIGFSASFWGLLWLFFRFKGMSFPRLCKMFKGLGRLFALVWFQLSKGFAMCVALIKMFKANNCPHVDWVD